ncbi:MAG TPA: hypothetical protein O0X64_02345 [Methanocorpusculum sp.]|nr:hypothetical protein [Methanocorpusculum sp.]
MDKQIRKVNIRKQMIFILTGIIIFLILTTVMLVGSSPLNTEDPQYVNGSIIVTFQYCGAPQEVWVQCTISRVNNLFSEEQIGNLMTIAPTFTSGKNICEFPIDLESGLYKTRLYVRERNKNASRIAAFIKNFEIV